jgi:hypothetical protein
LSANQIPSQHSYQALYFKFLSLKKGKKKKKKRERERRSKEKRELVVAGGGRLPPSLRLLSWPLVLVD